MIRLVFFLPLILNLVGSNPPVVAVDDGCGRWPKDVIPGAEIWLVCVDHKADCPYPAFEQLPPGGIQVACTTTQPEPDGMGVRFWPWSSYYTPHRVYLPWIGDLH